jgi:hypothetical protein
VNPNFLVGSLLLDFFYVPTHRKWTRILDQRISDGVQCDQVIAFRIICIDTNRRLRVRDSCMTIFEDSLHLHLATGWSKLFYFDPIRRVYAYDPHRPLVPLRKKLKRGLSIGPARRACNETRRGSSGAAAINETAVREGVEQVEADSRDQL